MNQTHVEMEVLVTACETVEDEPSNPRMTKEQAILKEFTAISEYLLFLHSLVFTIKMLVSCKESALFAKQNEKFQHQTLLSLFKPTPVCNFLEKKIDISLSNFWVIIPFNLKCKLCTFLVQAVTILRTYKTMSSMVLFTDIIASMYDEDLKNLIKELEVHCTTLRRLKSPSTNTSIEPSSDKLNPASKRKRPCESEEASN